MAYSYVRYTGNGSTTNYTFSFPTISTDHIKVRVNGTLVTNWSFLSASTIQFAAAPANAAVIEIRRETPKDSSIVNFTDGSVLLERDLDLLATWQLYVAQETEDDLEDTIRVDSLGRLDAQNRRIINVADPVAAQDAVTKNWLETTYTSELDAIALAAASSATTASTSATAAQTARTGAEAALDSFDDRYLGAKAVAPTVDNDGNTLLTGAVFWDTVSSQMFVWSGTQWKPTFLTGNAVRSLTTATAAQTVFTVPTYVVAANTLQVFVNGLKVLVGPDYTETNQNTITFVSGLSAGTEVEVVALQPYAIGTTGAESVSFQQAGSGSTLRNVSDKLRESVSVKDFGAVGDGSNEAAKFNAAANYAASIDAPLDLEGLTITYGGGFYCATAGAKVIWRNGGFKLTAGAKTSAAFIVDGIDTIDIENVELDGNRLNVSGNNAGFFVIQNTRLAKFDGIVIRDLRRYGINITPNVEIVDIKNVRGYDIGVTGIGPDGLGEAIKVELSTNVTVENFTCTNPSGTGGGQVAKVFHCKNVTLSNFDITDPDPAKVYPGISMVRNENLTYRNIRIAGSTQVALEDNANINISYDNIVTAGTDKALIMGTDGAALGDRRSQNTIINGWIDTSTQALAFNILGAKDITLKNVSTPQTINISRDDPTPDRRTENLVLDTVSCGVLNTFLVNGRKTYSNVAIAGLWTNTGAGVTDFINSTYGSYSNSGQTDVFLARWNFADAQINVSGTMTASGGTLVYRAPTTISNEPFAGEVLASSIFTGSAANQWSQIRWNFYDWGTPTALKTVLHSGSTPRSNVALAVSSGPRTLTFTNSEGNDIRIDAVVQFINRNSAAA